MSDTAWIEAFTIKKKTARVRQHSRASIVPACKVCSRILLVSPAAIGLLAREGAWANAEAVESRNEVSARIATFRTG